MEEVRSTCPYCGVGCGVIIGSEGGQIVDVRGDPAHPANFGRLCTKGSTLHLTAAASVTRQTRLLHPLRRPGRGASPERVSWDEAMDFATRGFARIIGEHGPDAVGFYVSGQLLTEDYYVFNKLAKGLIGTNNIDTNSRLCMSSAVAGYKQTLGADAPPGCYEDIDHAACIFIVGSNTAYAHPILFRRIEDAKAANPALKIVFCDPRRTDTAEIADLYLPLQPGTDVSLFNGMLHIMLWEGWTDNAYIARHTSGFDALKATVRDYTPDLVSETCGIRKDDLLAAARLFATSAATLSLYCQGLNQSSSGTAKNAALINLHLATGQIGRPGAAPFSLTGQPNAMGGREVGGMANLLSGHRDLNNPAHRAEVAALWGLDPSGEAIPEKRGKTAVEMFQAAADGEIRALWIACTNPAQSMPDQATVRRALARAELVIVQEAFSTTATCDYADLLLPATTWGEKTGTVTNSERRISRVLPAVDAPGETRHDWVIAVDFARRLERLLPARAQGAAAPLSADPSSADPSSADPSSGASLRPASAGDEQPASRSLFPYSLQVPAEGAESIWNEHRESTRGRDLDITGMSYAMLDQAPQQWPLPAGQTRGKARLYEDGIFPTSDGRARFVNTVYRPLAEKRESRFPFSLTTGRLRDQWHGMSRTGTLGRLFGHVAEPAVQMNPQDMARRRLKDGDLVQVTSRRGSIVAPAQASLEVGMSQAFIAMHWGEEYLSGRAADGATLAGINALTTSAYCPDSLQPELKHAAVRIARSELPWSLLAMAWLPEDRSLAARRQLRPLMTQFAYTSCVPFSNNKPLADRAGERTGLLFRAADKAAPAGDILGLIERALGLTGSDTIRYADSRKGQHRAVRLIRHEEQAELAGFVLAGDTSAEAWIRTLLQDELPAQAYGRLLLLPGARPPVAVQSRGRVVCSCFNVTDVAIDGQLALSAAASSANGSADSHANGGADGSAAGDADGGAAGSTAGSDQERLAVLQSALQCGTNCGSCIPELQRRVRASHAGPPLAGASPGRKLQPALGVTP